MKKNENSYKKSGVNILLANKLVKHISSLSKKDVIVMHPGPMNRGVEIDSEVADSDQSVILSQVTFGIAIRMAVMAMLIGKNI